MNSAVVTGANGFLGRALLRELSKNNVFVYAIVREETSDITEIQHLPGVKIIYCPLEHLNSITSVIHQPVDVFYHLAWGGCSGKGREDYSLQLKNAVWTLDAVNIACELKCKRFIGVGSSAEFEVDAYIKSDESVPNATSHYGIAKLAAHYMSKTECVHREIEYVWAYLANVYGPGDCSSNFINFAIKTILTGQSVDFTSGEQFYDFVHINDVAQGLFKVGNSGKTNSAYFIGSNQPRKLKEFICIIRDAVNPSIKLNLGAIPFRGVLLPKKTFDCGPLIRDTGYSPSIIFEEGIKSTIEWVRLHENLVLRIPR